MAHTTNCTACGPSKPCTCGTCTPSVLKTCTPGHFYRIECDAYGAMCIPKGFPFWVMGGGGCCEGLHIGSGGQGTAMDKVLQAMDLGAGLRWSGCKVSVDWDAICAAAEDLAASSPLLNDTSMLVCTSAGIKKADFGDLLNKSCFAPADAAQSCGVKSYAVWGPCEGGSGYKLMRYSAATAKTVTIAGMNLSGRPVNESKIWPTDFMENGGPYSVTEIVEADGNDQGINGRLNEARFVSNNVLASGTIMLECQTLLQGNEIVRIVHGSGATVEQMLNGQTSFGYRWRVNNGPWNYMRAGPDRKIAGRGTFNGMSVYAVIPGNAGLSLPAGTVEIQMFFYTMGAGVFTIPISANTLNPQTMTGGMTPYVTLREGIA